VIVAAGDLAGTLRAGVTDTDHVQPASRSSSMRESVVFPAPDGEDENEHQATRRTSRYRFRFLLTLRPPYRCLDLLRNCSIAT